MRYLTLAESAIPVPLVEIFNNKGFRVNGNTFASGTLYEGEKVHLQISGNPGHRADIILAEPSMVPLVSKPLLQSLILENVELGQVIQVDDAVYRGYSIINPLGLVDLIDREKSESFVVNGLDMYMKVVLKKYSGAEAFLRIKGYSVFPFVTEKAVSVIEKLDHTGVGFGKKEESD